MSDRVKVVRLSKAAREFNIALDTVVDFLSNKGFDVIKNPNTKLDPEMYSILQSEFQDEKAVKKASKERNLEFLGHGTISIGSDEPSKEKKEKNEDADIPDEVFITSHGVGKKIEKPVETEEVPEIEPTKEPEVIAEEVVIS